MNRVFWTKKEEKGSHRDISEGQRNRELLIVAGVEHSRETTGLMAQDLAYSHPTHP